MKIRTDFVTNSSSSSFVVEITLETVSGASYTTRIPDSLHYEEDACVNVNCSAESLLQHTSIESLMDAIYGAIEVKGDDNCAPKFSNGWGLFIANVDKSVESIDQISTLIFRRIWSARGENASCFGTNIAEYAPELYSSAKQLVKAAKSNNLKDIENRKKEMLFRLKYFDEKIGRVFPSGFMGSQAKCFLEIYNGNNDLVDVAKSIIAGKMGKYDNDEGIETTIIDLQQKTIRHGAVFGNCSVNGIWEDESEYEELASFVFRRLKQRYSKLRDKYLALIENISYYCGETDYYSKDFCCADFLGVDNLLLLRSVFTWDIAERHQNKDYYLIIKDYLPQVEDVLNASLKDQVDWLEWSLWKVPELVEEANRCGTPVMKESKFLADIEEEKRQGYPSILKVILDWKEKMPIDHISTISCEGKSFCTAGLGRDRLFTLLKIKREIPFWDAHPTRNWLIEKGANVQSDVTRNCDYLIVGMGATSDSPKVAKAVRYRDSGMSNIRIISEDELLRMLNGEILETSEEDRRIMQECKEAIEKAEREKEKEKQQAAEERKRIAEAARLKKAEEKEARRKAAAEVQEALRKEQEVRKEALLQQKAAEQEAREEKQRRDAEERERMIRENVLYRPGEEPADIRIRLAKLFEKLDGAYPDKKISGLNRDHKKVGERVTELYRLLGYPDNRAFLEAYGYTIAEQENKGGRPTTVDPEAFIEELKRRYPNGSGFKSVAALSNDNEDLPFKSMTNNAQKIFGMSLGDYLKSIGIL